MKSKLNYIPLHETNGKLIRYHLPSSKIVTTIVSLQLFSFLFCILWSILYNFEDSTSTHCHVYNFLPSISAAIGNYSPQKYIWNSTVIFALIPRLCVVLLYQKLYNDLLIPRALSISMFAGILNATENFMLVGLSFWSSQDYYSIHKTCFMIFIATSEIYMILTCLLLRTTRNKPLSRSQSRSLNLKWKCLFINIASFMCAGYFFVRHNAYCEPGVYSLFALSEYIVVITNIAFHITAALDFRDVILNLGNFAIYFD